MIALLLAASLAARGEGSIAGYVLTTDGDPVSGATVAAFDQRLEYVAALSDDAGAFEITDIPPGTWRLWAIPPDGVNRVARFAPDGRDFCRSDPYVIDDDEAHSGVEFSLPPGATLSGTLLDSGAEAVSEATITCDPIDNVTSMVDRSATTGEDGAFEVLGIDADEGVETTWVCEVAAEGWPAQYLGGTYDSDEAEAWAIGEQAGVEAGDHTLLDGIVVSGQVEGPEGPAADARVYVYSGSQIVDVDTDEDGLYEAWGLPPGDVLPWSQPDGLAMTYHPDADRPDTFISAPEEGDIVEDADLYPPAEAIFRAHITDAATGEALAGATALLYNSTNTVGRGDAADDDGHLAIDGLHGGEYTLYVWGGGQGATDDYVRDEDGEARVFTVEGEVDNDTVEIALPRSAVFAGTVEDTGGQPVHGATVTVQRDDGEWDRDTTERDGTWRIDGLPPGDWELAVEYEAWCEGDPGFVSVYWHDEVNPDWQTSVPLAEGEWVEDLVFALPSDDDHDGMADTWEEGWGLDTSRDDGGEDPDDDGYDNLTEFLLGTNPVEEAPGDGGCGCRDGGGAALMLLPLLGWRRRS